MRHLACTLMAETGVKPKLAQQLMGHASELTTLKIYTHLMNRRHHDSADKVAEFAGLTSAGNNQEATPGKEP